MKELDFIREVEKLKTVTRQNQTLDGRQENAAEHSWQLALMSQLFWSYVPQDLDRERVMSMLLVHDLGEIGVGDTSVFDEVGKATAYARERQSVLATFSLLDQERTAYFLSLWEEFEAGQTQEATYARAMDALAPLMNHLWTAQEGYNPTGLSKSQVLAKKAFIAEVSPQLWSLTLDLVEQSVARGLYSDQ